jgi:tetratricopeptide (TPR) repeat protein
LIVLLRLTPLPLPLITAQQLADRASESGNYADAVDPYLTAYQYVPWESDRLPEIALAYLNAGRFDEAESTLIRISQKGSLLPEELVWLGMAQAGQYRMDEAVATWEQARALGAYDESALQETLSVYLSSGNWNGSAGVLEALIALYPEDAHLWFRLGLIQALEEPDRSAFSLSQALRLNRAYAEDVAILDPILSDRQSLSRDLRYAQLGLAYLQINQIALAEEAYYRAVLANPRYAEAMGYLGLVRIRQGIPGGLGAVQNAVALEPDSLTVLFLAGLAWKELGRPAEARTYFLQGFRIDPANPAFPVEIAATYQLEANTTRAEVWLTEGVALAPDDFRLQILLAQFYVDEGYRVAEVGLPLAESLVVSQPENAEAHEALGWAFYQLGDLESAVQSIQTALGFNPDLARAHVHLGIIYETQGNITEAQAHFQKAMDMDPHGPWGTLASRAMSRYQ